MPTVPSLTRLLPLIGILGILTPSVHGNIRGGFLTRTTLSSSSSSEPVTATKLTTANVRNLFDDEFQSSSTTTATVTDSIRSSSSLSSVTHTNGSPPIQQFTRLYDDVESIDNHTLPSWFATAASAGMIGGGLLEVFFGYRIFRVTLFLLGMTAAGVPTFLISYDKIPDDNAVWIGLGLGVLAGLLGGILSFFFYKVGVFLCGAATGVVLSMVMNLTILYKFGGGNIPFIVCSVVLGLAFGALGSYFMRVTMILATTIIGAYAFIRGVGYFGGNYPSNEFVVAEEIENGDTDAITWQVYAYFAGWLCLIIVGIIVQVKVTAKKTNKDEKDQWEQAYDDAELTLDAITGKKGKKGKKNKKNKKSKTPKGKKSSKQITADALLRDYDQNGEFYEDGEYDDYDYDDENGGNDYGYEKEEPVPKKKGGILAMVGLKNKKDTPSKQNDFDSDYPAMNNMGSSSSSGKKGKGRLPASVQW